MELKWQLKEKARELRKLGWTYKEITKKVPVHKTTLSVWCKDIELTSEQIIFHGGRYANGLKGAKANQIKREKEIGDISTQARLEIYPLSEYDFKIAGAMLYWAEGDKTHGLGISNSDPRLIEFIMKWFREICGVTEEKIKATLYLHTGLDEGETKKYWSFLTGISLNRFGKTIFKEEGTASKKDKKYKGTIKINVFDENLKHRILSWIKVIINMRP